MAEVADVVEQIIPVLMEKADFLITIFEAVGVVLLIYIVYLIVKGVWRWKDRNRLKRIEKKIDEVDAKLDKLLKGKSEEKAKKSSKKKR